MDLVNQKVIHETFGTGNVINCNDSYIKINFKSGDKRFVFPDAFSKYITFTDKNATNLVGKLLAAEEKERRKEEIIRKREELIQEKEQALRQEQQLILDQKKNIKINKVHPKIQSVFWCKLDEEDQIFKEWTVSTGKIKSGQEKGQPKILSRMNQNSACLLTKRTKSMPEEDRQIIGAFMVNESFDKNSCEDGYIKAHPKYRLHLSEQESEKMLFWNYYVDQNSCNKIIWNSGRQRYFDNIWMAQILRDIAILKKNPQDQKVVQDFFEYFCNINFINQNELPSANGALMNI